MRGSTLENRPTQVGILVDLLRKRSPGWVSLPEILATRISQYNSRLWQARHELGLNIENRTEIIAGVKHSWYRLLDADDSGSEESDVSATFSHERQQDLGSLFQSPSEHASASQSSFLNHETGRHREGR